MRICGIHLSTVSQRVLKLIFCIMSQKIIHSKWLPHLLGTNELKDSLIISWTHWGRVTHICISKLNIIRSDNGLSPGWRQAIIWTNDGILLIPPLGTNFSEILSEVHIFSFKKMHLKISSVKWRPFCLCLNELTLSLSPPSVMLVPRSSMSCLHRSKSSVTWNKQNTLMYVPKGKINSLAPGRFQLNFR